MPMRFDTQHVAIDGQPGHAERMAQHDVGGLAADARQLERALHVGRHLAAVRATSACAMPMSAFDLARKKPVEWICGSSSAVVASPARARRDSGRTAPA